MTNNDITIRPATVHDLENGLLSILDDFGDTSKLTIEHASVIFEKLDQKVFVAVDNQTGKIIGTGSILIVQKLTHNSGKCGFVEDVVVRQDKRNQGIGRAIVERLIEYARQHRAYKATLSSNNSNVKFYEKCGFRLSSNLMRIDL